MMPGKFINGQPIKVGWGKTDKEETPGLPPCKNLWVGNIDPNTTEQEIQNLFSKFGLIENIRVLGHKNCAFVNFESLEAALEARTRLQGTPFKGKNLKINFGKVFIIYFIALINLDT